MGEYITPPSLPPDTYCRRLLIPNTPEWVGTVTGALMSLIYASEWKQTTGITPDEAADRAREMFNLYLKSGDGGECDDMACCDEKAIIRRVNPMTGLLEQSNNGGSTWTPMAGGWQSYITEPVPPVTSGVAATKCDAATNLAGQVDVWIDQVSNDFTTATSLLEFSLAILEAIAVAVVTVLTGGTFTPIQLLLLAGLNAGLGAAWTAGKVVFDAYWTTDVRDDILCAAYCTIGDDGSFTDDTFSAFWARVNAKLPASPAKMLFMGFLSSVGRQGCNAMAATGLSADADCSDCDCSDCECNFEAWVADGTFIDCTDGTVRVEALEHSGTWSVYMNYGGVSGGTYDVDVCRDVLAYSVYEGTVGSSSVNRNDCHTGTVHFGDYFSACAAQHGWVSNAPFKIAITYTDCEDCG